MEEGKGKLINRINVDWPRKSSTDAKYGKYMKSTILLSPKSIITKYFLITKRT